MSETGAEFDRPPRPAAGADLIVPVLALGLAAYYFASTVELVWEARATGTVIGLVLVALCVAQIARIGLQYRSGRAVPGFGGLFADTPFNRQRLGLFVITALFIVTLPLIGATLGLFLALIAGMWRLGVTRVPVLLGVAFGTAVLVHLSLITLLDSKLPRGILFQWLAVQMGWG